jgi:hypothetical protein
MDEGNHRIVQSIPFTAKPGKHFDEETIKAASKAMKDKLDGKSTGHRYRMVRLGTGRFRFVWGKDQSAA